ncbi:MAG TPA: EAL domain-containing protein [Noviherbaspirillum sp.]|uniref:sensor domain-containing protein n=1 Tax=Noviherbaspirillum sp. TaxID=1926288 RepID=UPI002D23626F|nr:EAL domain-containing protein [Noviherbaspirillum sp.]HYD96955.1 EAL domain-containing protein [Noviherbaspirillum sp.]
MEPTIDIYRLIVEQAVDPIFVSDSQGRAAYANPAALQLFGFSREELAGKVLHDMLHGQHPDGRPFPRDACPLYRACVTGAAVNDCIASFIRKDGIFVTLSCTCIPVDLGGETGQVFFARDVTARLEAAQALAESEQRFRLIADSMPQLVWIMSPKGKITYINERFRQYVGAAVEFGTDAKASQPVHPDDLAHTEAVLAEAMRTGAEFRIEHRGRAADRSYRWFLTRGVPLKNAQGDILAWYGSSTDIDDIRRAGEALLRSQETLRLAAELTGLGLWEYYTETGELVWDETTRRAYGVPLQGPVSYKEFIDRIHPDDRKRVDRVARRFTVRGSTGRLFTEYRIIRQNDGAERWLKVNGESLQDRDGTTRFVGTTLDITESKLAEQRIRDASRRDTLTGLPNRALLFEYCEHLLAIAQRTRSSGALLFIDLDRFKPINDTHGHDVGDQVLRQVAQRLTACTRQEDVVGRLGGDEFVVALPHPDDVHGPATVAGHLVERISEPYHVGELQLHLSPSIGISLYPRHGDNLDALIKCADAAMYEAKKAGRKRYRFYTPALEHGQDPYMQLELRLRDAVEHGELLLLYQPMMNLGTGAIAGVEALLRLPMGDGVDLVPEQFLHVAEAAGLINRIGEWVAQEACSQHQRWREDGLPPISVAINVAAQQFRQRSFIAYLAHSMQHSGMDPSCLQIELKESTVLEDVHDTIAALEEIRALGIRVALDDFGVGYSSVRLLSSLPLDKLKIDQSFVNGIGRDAKSQVIADSVLALGRSLNLQVVGEGIESGEVVDYLRAHGCDEAQGYYFSRPMAANEFAAWYRGGRAERRALQ